MGLDLAIQLLQNVFMNTSFAGSYWIYQLMFLFGSLLIITRNYKDWGALALPVITGWHYIGFHYNQIFFIIAGIIFVVDALTLKTIEAGLISIKEGIVSTAKKAYGTQKEERMKGTSILNPFKRVGKIREKSRSDRIEAKRKFEIDTEERQIKDMESELARRARRNKIFERVQKGDKRPEEMDMRPNRVRVAEEAMATLEGRSVRRPVKTQVQEKMSSWDAFNKFGASGKKKSRGTLKEAILKKSKELGRRLSTQEVRDLYDEIGGRK